MSTVTSDRPPCKRRVLRKRRVFRCVEAKLDCEAGAGAGCERGKYDRKTRKHTMCCVVLAASGMILWSPPLSLQLQGRPAHALTVQVNIHFNAVRDVDEGDAAVHAVVFAVKSHHTLDFA